MLRVNAVNASCIGKPFLEAIETNYNTHYLPQFGTNGWWRIDDIRRIVDVQLFLISTGYVSREQCRE